MASAQRPEDPSLNADDEVRISAPKGMLASEDWWAVWLGGLILLLAIAGTYFSRPADYSDRLAEVETQATQVRELQQQAEIAEASTASESLSQQIDDEKKQLKTLRSKLDANPLQPWLALPRSWSSNPLNAFLRDGKPILAGIVGALAFSTVLFGFGATFLGARFAQFVPAFIVVFLLASLAYVLATQEVVEYYNLEYPLWALLLGLLISNTVRTPTWLHPAVRTEFYIKTGLVLLGAEVLFGRLLSLGLPGVFVSWVVTPVVLIGTYQFGQRVLRMPSRSLNLVISADMSVCGVSAAIATAAACRAKKEELTLAIALSLVFTVVMMVVMPPIIKAVGMSEVLGGAWIGGTIDSTGAVAAAGGMLGPTALTVAATVKMIQNILIGAVAFAVAVYWVAYVERRPGARPDVREIWYRFPKFVLGFVAASILFSMLHASGVAGESMADAVIGSTKTLRAWFFCLGFVSIGLETNFRELSRYLAGGKPLILYVCGQALNLTLTLLMAWLMFEKVFPHAAAALSQ